MKTYTFLILALLGIILNSCGSQNYVDKITLEKMLADNTFQYNATRANPTNYDVINVMNSLPYHNTSRMLDLDSGYGFNVKNNILEVTLPYFGRMYSPSLDSQKNSFRFTSKDYGVEKVAGKKGNTLVIFKPHDADQVRRLILDVYKNGSAYLTIDANDRQPISYQGYLSVD